MHWFYLKGVMLAYTIPWIGCLSQSNRILVYGFRRHQSGVLTGEAVLARKGWVNLFSEMTLFFLKGFEKGLFMGLAVWFLLGVFKFISLPPR
jgi:hypothetical protein